MRRLQFTDFLMCAVTCSLVVQGADASEIAETKREYRSARYLGSGDAGVAAPEGMDSIFYNPAGLALSQNRLNEILLLSPQVTISRKTGLLLKEQFLGDGLTMGSLMENMNTPHHFSQQNLTGISFDRVSLGVFESSQLDAYMGNSLTTGLPLAEVKASAKVGAYLSLARGFASDNIVVGATLKYVHKAEAEKVIGMMDLESISAEPADEVLKSLVKRGTGAGADLGLLLRYSDADMKPTLGVVWRNAGGMRYRLNPKVEQEPSEELSTVDVGIAILPGTKKSLVRLTADLRDVLNKQNESLYKRLHVGGMITFQGVLGAMAGLNQGYPTFGGFLDLKFARLESGVFSEEIGKFAGDRRDYRYFGRLSVGWTQ